MRLEPRSPQWWRRLGNLPARPVSINPARTTSVQLVNGAGLFCGFVVKETAGAAGVIQIFDGGDTTGSLLCEFGIAVNTLAAQSFRSPGVKFSSGLFWSVLSGTAAPRGAVFAKFEQ